MGKTIYVNGGILVKTRYFSFRAGCGCLFDKQPEGSILLDPEEDEKGNKCLVIDDDHPQSIFNTYYAKTYLTALCRSAGYYRDHYSECFSEAKEELKEVEKILSSITSIEPEINGSLMKFLYINVITIIDSFICSIILASIFRDEKIFLNYFHKMISNSDKVKIEKYLIEDNRGQWEKEIVDIILRTSFENMEKIKDSFSAVGFKKPQDKDSVMSKHFHIRGVLVHRNGKMKDGKKMVITEDMLKQLIIDTVNFIDDIKMCIPQNLLTQGLVFSERQTV